MFRHCQAAPQVSITGAAPERPACLTDRVARHRPLRPLCDAKFGRTVRSRLYDDLYIVP
jgi:hypothetical protein